MSHLSADHQLAVRKLHVNISRQWVRANLPTNVCEGFVDYVALNLVDKGGFRLQRERWPEVLHVTLCCPSDDGDLVQRFESD